MFIILSLHDWGVISFRPGSGLCIGLTDLEERLSTELPDLVEGPSPSTEGLTDLIGWPTGLAGLLKGEGERGVPGDEIWL